MAQDHSSYAAKIKITEELENMGDKVSCGPLVLAYDEYNQERDSVRIHYNPTREEHSWLSTDRFPSLQHAFKKSLEYASESYPATYFTSSTWLNNVPDFIKLFPDSFNKQMENRGEGSFLGMWGQFIKSNGYGNEERLKDFIAELETVNTFEKAIEAIPLKVLEGVGLLDEFYSMYAIKK
ncbi:MAG: hypothetical protein ACOCXT_03210 [Candidatus Dojkabacteria bacterium]